MSVNYKILCEVKLLHEYYLTDKDGTTIFEKPLQSDRLDFLRKRFQFNYPSVNDHLEYEPSDPAKLMFGNLKLRVIQSYSGFKLFTSVKEQILAGNIKAYKPLQPLANNLPVLIQLRRKNTAFDSLSNNSINKPLPGKYYFTNRNMGFPQVSPILSRPISNRDDTLRYEQGELTFDTGDNKVKAFFFETNGAINWQAVKASGYVNSNDQCLLPVHFHYTFSLADNVTNANFVLKDSTNTTVSTISRSDTKPLKKIALDYSALLPSMLKKESTVIPDLYSLEVTGSNGYSKVHSILFCENEFLQPDTWGIIHLQPRVTNPLFNLLDNAGLLITRKNADGSIVPWPVFEIRLKSRFAFWRYINNKKEKILINAALSPFVIHDATKGYMETKQMKNLSYTPIEFSNTIVLPNPHADDPLKSELKRVYNEIYVPESQLFKV